MLMTNKYLMMITNKYFDDNDQQILGCWLMTNSYQAFNQKYVTRQVREPDNDSDLELESKEDK